jgi:hypothetical protein
VHASQRTQQSQGGNKIACWRKRLRRSDNDRSVMGAPKPAKGRPPFGGKTSRASTKVPQELYRKRSLDRQYTIQRKDEGNMLNRDCDKVAPQGKKGRRQADLLLHHGTIAAQVPVPREGTIETGACWWSIAEARKVGDALNDSTWHHADISSYLFEIQVTWLYNSL